MAGVGFSLKKLGSGDSYFAMTRVYGTAAMISSGPWLISILTLLIVGVVARRWVPDTVMLQRFQVSVTWIFAASLVFAGPMQLLLTRFVADRIYEKKDELVLPNLLGALGITSAVAGVFALGLFPLFAEESIEYRCLLGTGFVILCNIWLVIAMLSGIREHREIFYSFLIGYGVTFGGIFLLAKWGEEGLLAGFVLGQGVLLLRSLHILTSRQTGDTAVAWGFFRREQVYPELLLIGLFFNGAIWIDKLLFWLNPLTSVHVLGPLRSSEVYDLPIFLAYLAIVPGMAVFLLRIETDYAEKHTAFYDALVSGATLGDLEQLRNRMSTAARRGILDICKVQGLVVVLCIVFAPEILRFFGISTLHVTLFYVDVLGVSLQVILLTVISILFYLDRRITVLALTGLLLVSNTVGTVLSQQSGVAFYGFGFTGAVSLTCLVGLIVLRAKFDNLVMDTFMQRPTGG